MTLTIGLVMMAICSLIMFSVVVMMFVRPRLCIPGLGVVVLAYLFGVAVTLVGLLIEIGSTLT